MSDACREWRGDIAALALGRLQPDERARVVAHSDACTDCRAELTMLEHLGRAMTHADATRLDHEPSPPPGLRDRIITRLHAEREVNRRNSRRRVRRAFAGIAAAVLVALGAGVALHESGGSHGIQFASALPDTHGSFALHRNSTGTSITFTHEGLDPDEVYWLWLTDASGKRVAAGTFRGTPSTTTVTMQAALPIDRVVRVWVTDQADATVLDKVL
jgi:anti-sigma factor ChrR (cupin superfamily)